MLIKREKEKESKDKNKSKTTTTSNRSSINSPAPYNEIKAQMEKLFDYHNYQKDHKESSRSRTKGSLSNQNNIIKCFMHQPIVNNFINISQQEPAKIKTSLKEQKAKLAKQPIERRQFNYKYIIGKGGFGKVWKVEHTKNRNMFAMKQMLKSIVLTKKSVQSIINQQKLLSKLSSPFIVNMHYAFQDRETLYLVLDLMEGGDLRHHLTSKSFNQIQAKFFVACIVLGLEYLHSNLIIHRDIKPENLVLDNRGYVRITDLGIARIMRAQNSSDTSGTPGYMSPQVICRQNHTFVSDLFALGVIAHQLMLGRRPYNGQSRQQIREHILAKQAAVKPYEVPQGWSMESMDFINRLLQRKPQQRLGFKGIQQVKQHPWIQNLNWKSLFKKQIQSPFLPLMRKADFDQDQKITVQDEQQAQLIQKNALLLRKAQFQQLFKQYYFDMQQKTNETTEQSQKDKSKRGYIKSAKGNARQKSNRESPKGFDPTIANMTQSIPFGKQKANMERETSYFLKDYKDYKF